MIIEITPYTKIILIGQVPVFPDAGKYQKRNSILTKVYKAPERFEITEMQKPFSETNDVLLKKSRE